MGKGKDVVLNHRREARDELTNDDAWKRRIGLGGS